MIDYVEALQTNRSSAPEFAATSHRASKRKSKRLTSTRKRARLKASVGKVSRRKGKAPPQKTPEGSPMAKARKGKKRRTAKQKAATAKMIRANRAARRAKGGETKPKRRRRSSMRAATGTATPRKRHRRAAATTAPRRRRRKSGSRRRAPRSRTQTTRTVIQKLPGHTTRIAVVPVPAAARTSRKRKGSGGKRRKSRKGGSRKRRRSPGAGGGFGYRRKGAMENPMTGVELFVGGVTGVVGFLTADFIDRLMATHSLTVATAPTATTAGTYTDTPPSTGDYAGLYNATAICAPMDAKRWIAGILTAGVPITIAHFISAPTGRAALQFFGVAAGFRIVGKAMIDLVAMVSKNTQLGQQLYDGEMRAEMLKSNGGAQTGSGGSLATLPSAGLGRARLGAGCACGGQCDKCKTGAGYPPVRTGAGYPSMPREVASPQAPAPPPPPPATVTSPSALIEGTSTRTAPPPLNPNQSTLTGVPRTRSRFGSWGDPSAM